MHPDGSGGGEMPKPDVHMPHDDGDMGSGMRDLRDLQKLAGAALDADNGGNVDKVMVTIDMHNNCAQSLKF
eukprot:1627457-Karenia_brevis.AAC.1